MGVVAPSPARLEENARSAARGSGTNPQLGAEQLSQMPYGVFEIPMGSVQDQRQREQDKDNRLPRHVEWSRHQVPAAKPGDASDPDREPGQNFDRRMGMQKNPAGRHSGENSESAAQKYYSLSFFAIFGNEKSTAAVEGSAHAGVATRTLHPEQSHLRTAGKKTKLHQTGQSSAEQNRRGPQNSGPDALQIEKVKEE